MQGGHARRLNAGRACKEVKCMESVHARRLTHLCPPLRSTFAVRETASLGIMGEPRVPP